ncbi:MAG: hypothetical protein ACI92S_001155, partial [Planctomycetaceae bacterium]
MRIFSLGRVPAYRLAREWFREAQEAGGRLSLKNQGEWTR